MDRDVVYLIEKIGERKDLLVAKGHLAADEFIKMAQEWQDDFLYFHKISAAHIRHEFWYIRTVDDEGHWEAFDNQGETPVTTVLPYAARTCRDYWVHTKLNPIPNDMQSTIITYQQVLKFCRCRRTGEITDDCPFVKDACLPITHYPLPITQHITTWLTS